MTFKIVRACQSVMGRVPFWATHSHGRLKMQSHHSCAYFHDKTHTEEGRNSITLCTKETAFCETCGHLPTQGCACQVEILLKQRKCMRDTRYLKCAGAKLCSTFPCVPNHVPRQTFRTPILFQTCVRYILWDLIGNLERRATRQILFTKSSVTSRPPPKVAPSREK